MIPLVTVAEMRRAETKYCADEGDLSMLVRRAGQALADAIPSGARTLILVGPGNNGGDGLEAAAAVASRGDAVVVFFLKEGVAGPYEALELKEDRDLTRLRSELGRADVVVDALLGIGTNRRIEGDLAELITAVNDSRASVRLAADIPTGVDADTGHVATVAFRATKTITFGFAKRGLWGSPGAEYVGAVELANIGIAPLRPAPMCHLIEPADVSSILPRRSQEWNKGKSGTLLVIGGSSPYRGAPVLVANAAYRAGAGLVTIATPMNVEESVAVQSPESVFAPLQNSTYFFTSESVEELSAALDKADAYVLGPGMSTHPETVKFACALFSELRGRDIPGVVDADALNVLSTFNEWWRMLPSKSVLTPHPGEMSRLMRQPVSQIQSNRFDTAASAAIEWGSIVVLKGSRTIVAHPDGMITVNPTGGPNLAVAGTGDVLSGVIGSLLAQGMTPRDAAYSAVYLHGLAGDALRHIHGDSGTMASDLWLRISTVRKTIEEISHESS